MVHSIRGRAILLPCYFAGAALAVLIELLALLPWRADSVALLGVDLGVVTIKEGGRTLLEMKPDVAPEVTDD